MHVADNFMLFWIFILLILFATSIEDLRKKEIPAIMPIACAVDSALYAAFNMFSGKVGCTDLFVAFLPGVVLILIGVATRQALGYGDGLITLSFSPVLGLSNVCMSLVIAMMFSAIASVIILTMKKGNRNTRLPFVPFITLGVGVTFLAQL